MRKIKCYGSLNKEIAWLEEMAQKGYFLTNLRMGLLYTFEKGEPRRLVYDIDRFDLPRYPTLREIENKNSFLSLAREMGWREVTHDEDMNYYFCREYEEDGVRELYDDEEGRNYHAAKYRDRFMTVRKSLNQLALILGVGILGLGLCLKSFVLISIGVIYFIIFGVLSLVTDWFARNVYQEFSLGREQWERLYGKQKEVKTERRIYLTSAGLCRYLQRKSAQGWRLIRAGFFTYYFEKAKPREQYFSVDTKSSVNKRLKNKRQGKIGDRKDINQQNNDWQVRSVEDAKAAGFDFVCANGNNYILYAADRAGILEGQNRFLYERLAQLGLAILIGAAIGFAAGYGSTFFAGLALTGL